MKLIICDSYIRIHEREKIANLVNGTHDYINFDGDPFSFIKDTLTEDIDILQNEICVTADERMLLLYPEVFKLEDIYIYSNNEIRNIQDCTNKELRDAHNLFNMYIAGAFNIN